MSKRSIDKEFYPKAEAMMLAGMGQFQIVEELSKEYYDKKQIRNALDRIIRPEQKETLMKQKRLLSILGAFLLLVNIGAYLYSDGWATEHNVTNRSIDNFMLGVESLLAIGFVLEYFMKSSKITYRQHMFGASIFTLGNIGSMFSYMPAEVYVSILQLTLWVPLLILNIKWFTEERKESKEIDLNK